MSQKKPLHTFNMQRLLALSELLFRIFSSCGFNKIDRLADNHFIACLQTITAGRGTGRPVAAGDSLLEALDEALQRFEHADATACELVKLRYFAGLSLREAGEALDLAPRTADRLWAYAKTWLLREVRRDAADSS